MQINFSYSDRYRKPLQLEAEWYMNVRNRTPGAAKGRFGATSVLSLLLVEDLSSMRSVSGEELGQRLVYSGNECLPEWNAKL